MNKYRYSIITSLYNQLEYLPQLIRSLEAQTFKDFEVIFCDDGSKDGTKEYLKDSQYQYYRNWFDLGMRMAKVVNKGIKKAKGKYCVFLMGDTYPPANYLEELNKHVMDNRIICGIRTHVKKGKTVGEDYRLIYNLVPKNNVLLHGQVWKRITGNGLVIPRKWLKEIGGWAKVKGYGADDTITAFRLWTKGLEFLHLYTLVLYHNWHNDRETKPKNYRALTKEIGSYHTKHLVRFRRLVSIFNWFKRAFRNKKTLPRI